jgi:hypothetical protein
MTDITVDEICHIHITVMNKGISIRYQKSYSFIRPSLR